MGAEPYTVLGQHAGKLHSNDCVFDLFAFRFCSAYAVHSFPLNAYGDNIFALSSFCVPRLYLGLFVRIMFQGKLPALADNDEILAFIEKTGVDELAIAGGFDPAEIVKAS